MDKEIKLEEIKIAIDKQSYKFRNTLFISITLMIGILILLGVNIYSSVGNLNNPAPIRIMLYVVLVSLFIWDLYVMINNIIGIITLKKIDNVFKDNNFLKTDVLNLKTNKIFFGSLYIVIDSLIQEYVEPLKFHLTVKRKNLKTLNWKLGITSLLITLSGIAFFISEIIYFKNNQFEHWETILGLCLMIVAFLWVFLFTIPRQIIINKKVNLNNKNKIEEYDYFFKFKVFGCTNTLEKFWNK